MSNNAYPIAPRPLSGLNDPRSTRAPRQIQPWTPSDPRSTRSRPG